MQDRRLEDTAPLSDLYNQLIEKRNKEAINAGFKNYRDYRFKELGRFDYTAADCFQFHEAVKLHVMPLVNIIYQKKHDTYHSYNTKCNNFHCFIILISFHNK